MESLRQDARFAVRTLLRSPGFTLGAMLTLALGIGGSTAIFSVVNTVLLRPLPFRDGDRLVRVQQTVARPDGTVGRVGVSQLNFAELRARSRAIESAVAHRFRSMIVAGSTEPERVVAIQVSDGWLRTVGVLPQLGRAFTAEEEAQGADARVVMLGHGVWQRRFAGARDVIGRTLSLDGRPHTIVGVMPAGYAYPYSAEMWVPLRIEPARGESRDLNITVRLRPGVTLEQFGRELAPIADALARAHAVNREMAGLVARPMRVELVGEFGRVLVGLLAAVGFVLLIACVNVANLLLVRGAARRREFGIRAALGAARSRLVRQLLTESVLLSLAGGVVGIALAAIAGGAFASLIPEPMRDVIPAVRLDPSMLAFAAAVCLATGLAFGLVPAWRTASANLVDTLKSGAVASSASGLRPLHVMVVAEVAISVVLLVGGGLLLRDLQRRLAADIGIDTRGVLTLNVAFPEARYADAGPRTQFVAQLEERLASLPGIAAAGMTTILPYGGSNALASVRIERAASEAPSSVNHRLVTPGFFRAFGLRLLRGRLLTERDVAGAEPVVVISNAMARRYWPGADPLGQRVRQQSAGPDAPWLTIVGVVGDVVQPDALLETWYLPYAQGAPFMPTSFSTLNIVVVARTTGDPAALTPAVSRAVHEIDGTLPIFDIALLARLHAEAHGTTRLSATITGAFAALGLLLAALGIYGVVSYALGRRRREIGIRMALGARPVDVMRDAIAESAKLVGAGLALGLAGALALTRLMMSLLREVEPHDPATFAAVAVVLLVVGLAAAWVPARRASRLDPLLALRSE